MSLPGQTSTCAWLFTVSSVQPVPEHKSIVSPACTVSPAPLRHKQHSWLWRNRKATRLCVHERELTVLSEFGVLVRVYTAHRPQNKAKPSALRRSGFLTASQTAPTAPFNLTNNSLLTEAFLWADLCVSEHILTQQGKGFLISLLGHFWYTYIHIYVYIYIYKIY